MITNKIVGAVQHGIHLIMVTNVIFYLLCGYIWVMKGWTKDVSLIVPENAPTTSWATPMSGLRYLQVWLHNNEVSASIHKFLSPRKRPSLCVGTVFCCGLKFSPNGGVRVAGGGYSGSFEILGSSCSVQIFFLSRIRQNTPFVRWCVHFPIGAE